MSKLNVKRKDKLNDSGWDAAIADAKSRIVEFRRAIRIYSLAKARGEPWPGAQSSDQNPDAATRN